jgi:hypothetical protein
MTHPFIHTVEKCAHCHLFVESNDAVSVEQGFAEYIHLSRGDEADEAIEGTHEAKPSGLIATLDTWKQFGPLEMRKRFTDYVPQPSIIMYWVGETLDDALAGLPWEDFDGANECRKDNDAVEQWSIWSIESTLETSTATIVTN